jgi:hypothetical protein
VIGSDRPPLTFRVFFERFEIVFHLKVPIAALHVV